MSTKFAVIVLASFAVICLATLMVQAQTPAVPGPDLSGRFQLVAENDSPLVHLVDSATGRVWRYTLLTDSNGERVENNPCSGFVACFIEVDRLSLTTAGWTSEIIGPR